MVILSKACKLDKFELHNSLKLCFHNIWGLHSSFIGFESFLSLKILDILFLFETNFDDSNNASNIGGSGYHPLIH